MYRLRQVNFDLAIQRSSRTRDFNRNAPNGEDFEMKTYLAVSFGTLAGMAIGGFAVPGRRASATSPAVGTPTEALDLAQIALSIHDKVLGQNHDWTKDSAPLPTRSTRLAAPRRRRCCGSGMASRGGS
jgi:hypothetical protein